MQFFAFYKTYYLHTQLSMPQEDKVGIKMTEKKITFPEEKWWLLLKKIDVEVY